MSTAVPRPAVVLLWQAFLGDICVLPSFAAASSSTEVPRPAVVLPWQALLRAICEMEPAASSSARSASSVTVQQRSLSTSALPCPDASLSFVRFAPCAQQHLRRAGTSCIGHCASCLFLRVSRQAAVFDSNPWTAFLVNSCARRPCQ